MKSGQLVSLLEAMKTAQELMIGFYPSLLEMNESEWEESHLGSTKDNDLFEKFHALDHVRQEEISMMLRDLPVEDLIEVQSMSEREVNARRGLLLMQQSQTKLMDQIDAANVYLREFQSIREFGQVELDRRVREKTIKDGGGEHLDAFTSRFLFGPAPQPIVPAKMDHYSKPLDTTPKARDFFIAQVKSGKHVAVSSLRFTIPEAYDAWLVAELVAAKVHEPNKWGKQSAPRYTEPAVARIYYNLGFKPDSLTTMYYHFSWHDSNWNHGWNYSHSRMVKTSDLVPVD